jgi:hypothetical protein
MGHRMTEALHISERGISMGALEKGNNLPGLKYEQVTLREASLRPIRVRLGRSNPPNPVKAVRPRPERGLDHKNVSSAFSASLR